MPARVNLSTTTLDRTVTARDSLIRLASTSGVLPGKFLYFDGELCKVVALDVDQWVKVLRGQDGSRTIDHPSSVTVYIGDGGQFYQTDPVGRPPETFEVSPWINVQNGTVWFAQGDNDPVGLADRWWQVQRTTYDQGPLGIRVKTPDPVSST
jgi:hypothetical protein